ncbi:beta-mannosidase [Psychromicrobium silvestre]|uniref:beta-mannosidase n=1 Tax=Psychromicrobium silvestre TaxID=1645614 RepID=A0A7Y9LUL2_9MICC|nr:glycoside hydrolase family 2 protein [Psychromicrobium silvestre]NYE95904.1 beta-mannosidase [Psychromicrobium silvestre]
MNARETTSSLTDFEITHTDSTITLAQLGADCSLAWIPASVPGEVHAALVDQGQLRHPYLNQHEDDARWVEDRVWWYRSHFDTTSIDAEDERLRLVFHGLDSVATIWLNGVELGHHENMFRPAIFEVSALLQPQNTLIVRLDVPLAGLSEPESAAEMARRIKIGMQASSVSTTEETTSHFDDVRHTLRRKSSFSWGWDFAPRLPSVGIWRPVELLREKGAVIAGHHFRTQELDLERRVATAVIDVEVDRFAYNGRLSLSLGLRSPDGISFETPVELAEAESVASVTFEITEVHPWWTHDLGTPNRYELAIDLFSEDGLLDQKRELVGIRTITLDRTADAEGGNRFQFILNGQPIYSRGACLVPTTMMLGTTSPNHYRQLVEMAAAAQMNMIRVWGGGVYEDEVFFQAADERGILVWQDFLLACLDYPSEDPQFAEEIALEARYQVRRLRNHPSLALWAGNNEVQAMHQLAWGNLDPGNWGYDFFHELFPSVIAAESPEIPYSPGSPWGQGDPAGVNGVLDGDRHAWEVWHGIGVGAVSPEKYASQGEAMHFERYKYDTGKFISEFGLLAAPERKTLERWISAEHLALDSPVFRSHIKDNPKGKGDALLEIETGLPLDVDEYIDFTMATQAEGLKFGIEHYRRQSGNSGALVWQLNDPWPGMSWSLIDHDLRPKAGYHFVQRAFAPILASFFRRDDGGLELWLSNSTSEAIRTTLVAEIETISGSSINKVILPTTVGAGETKLVFSWAANQIGTGSDRVAWVNSTDNRVAANRTFFAHLKDISWPQPSLSLEFESTGKHSGVLTLSSDAYSYLTRVSSSDRTARFDRNYLDLRPRESIKIKVTDIEGDPSNTLFTAQSYRGATSVQATHT